MVKHGHKKEEIKKTSLLYHVKTSEDKKERNLNEGKFELKPSFKKGKTKVLSTRRYRIYVSQIEKLISGIIIIIIIIIIITLFSDDFHITIAI